MTQGIKLAARRDRPPQIDGNQSSTYSFPSGHATITFAAATVLQQHLGYRAAMGVVVGRSVTFHGRNFYASPMLLPDGGGLQLARAH